MPNPQGLDASIVPDRDCRISGKFRVTSVNLTAAPEQPRGEFAPPSG